MEAPESSGAMFAERLERSRQLSWCSLASALTFQEVAERPSKASVSAHFKSGANGVGPTFDRKTSAQSELAISILSAQVLAIRGSRLLG
jgi:hypothetical protein